LQGIFRFQREFPEAAGPVCPGFPPLSAANSLGANQGLRRPEQRIFSRHQGSDITDQLSHSFNALPLERGCAETISPVSLKADLHRAPSAQQHSQDNFITRQHCGRDGGCLYVRCGFGRAAGRQIDRAKGGMNTNRPAVTDANGRPISFFKTARQVSDYTGAAALLDALAKPQWLLANRGYAADGFREALQEKRITPCISARKIRSRTDKYDESRYRSQGALRSSWNARKAGGASQHAMTDARRPSSSP
jgi:hypothetical protein